MARNKKVEILSNDKEVLHPMTDGDCVIFEDGQTLAQKLSEDDSVKYTPEIVNSSPMFKVGEGNTVDYSDNVLDGAYERATLQGQTYTNYIQESSADEVTLPTPFTEYERTQHNTLTSNEEGTLGINLVGQSYVNALQHDSEEEYVVLGESLEFQEKKVEYTNEGQIKSAMLKGQTLVNIVDRTEITGAKTYCYLHLRHYKPQATYTYLIFNAPTNMTKIYLGQSNGTQLWCGWTSDFKRVGSTIIKTVVCPESQTLQYTLPHFEYSGDKSNSIDNLRIMLIEGDHSNEVIPYFEGMQSVTVSTKLENICQYADVENPKTGKTFNTSSSANRILTFMRKATTTLHFKPNTKYLVQFKISNLVLDGIPNITLILHGSILSSGDCLFGEQSELQISSNNIYRAIFKTTDVVDTSEFVIKGGVGEWEGSGSTLRSLTISEVMCIEYQNGMENWDLPYFEDYQVMKPVQVETHNDYDATDELYQSKTTYSWDEVILRKIGDVEDTLDLTTGEWVQRIGEFVLDGSDDEVWQQNTTLPTWTTTNEVQDSFGYIYYFQHNYKPNDYITFHEQESGLYTLCDKLPVYSRNSELGSKTNLCTTGGATPSAIQNNEVNTYIGIKLDTTKATTLDEFKVWLKQNPLKVHVVMNKPIVHKVNLSRPNLQVYDDITHVHTKCLDGTLIPNIYLPSDVSYPAILESNTTYNVSINHTQVNTDNPLKVNVGGTEITMTDSRMTLTTPTTLANSNVSFTGKGNKIKESMLIKNSSLLTRDLPHFNGIGSVQLGKTIENLCSASGFKAGSSNAKITWYDNYAHTNISAGAGSCVFVYELVKPLENGKKYFVYSPINLTGYNRTVSFRNVYNNTRIYSKQAAQIDSTYKNIIEINQEENLYTHIVVGCHYTMQLNTEFDTYRPIICEYEPGMENWDWESIGYFTGTKNIGNEFMRVQNKNLFITNNATYGAVHYNLHDDYYIVNNSKTRVTMKELIKINKNSTLTLSCNNGFNCVIQEYISPIQRTSDNDAGWKDNHTLVLNEKTNYVNIYFRKSDDTDFTDAEMEELKNSIQLEESSTATTYTANKHNGLYITKDQPIELTWEQGAIFYESGVSWSQMTNNVNSMRIRTPQPLTLEPNKTYRVSLGSDKYQYGIQLYNGSNNGVFDYGWNTDREFIFTTTKDKYKVGIAVGKIDSSNSTPITPSEINHVRLEEVTDVVLRSCSGRYDELDLTRGTYTQNVGVVYVDGVNQYSNYITVVGDSYQPTDTTLKTFDIRCDGAVVDSICLSNRFPMRESMESTAINFESVRIHSTNTSCRLTIKKEKASTVDEFKLWLQDNPLEIIYALKTPIVHKVHIGNKNEANTEVAKPNDVFTLPTLYTEKTHIDLTNNGIMPKVQSRDYIAYPVLPMIGRTYTLQHNLTGGVSNLTVDLLGRTQQVTYQNHKSLVYTPETMDAILHNELRISGKGKISKVMYIDGGYMYRDIPYIEGMKNAVNPIVKNYTDTQENICYVDCGEIRLTPNMFEQGGFSGNQDSTYEESKANMAQRYRIKELCKVEPNTTYNIRYTEYDSAVFEYGVDKKKLTLGYNINKSTLTITTSANCHYLAFNFVTSTLPTQYISIIKVSEIKQMRSLPHGVHDEIDLETGTYIQRVGEITFNGTENWIVGYSSWDNKRTYYNNGFVDLKTMKGDNGSGNAYYDAVRCPQLHRSYMGKLAGTSIDGICSYYYNGYQRIFISKQDCATVNELKLWLKENPITVQYELPEPIVKDIVIHNYPHSYEGGHAIIENGDPNTPIPAQLTYRAVTNRSGQIQQHTEQVEKQEREINELETLILANIHLSQTR